MDLAGFTPQYSHPECKVAAIYFIASLQRVQAAHPVLNENTACALVIPIAAGLGPAVQWLRAVGIAIDDQGLTLAL